MKRRSIFLLLLALSLILSACSNKTVLRFSNQTTCGTAAISVTDTQTGFIRDYTVNEGKTVEIKITPNVDYHYEVTYSRQANRTICDSKKVTTKLDKGQTVNIRLESVIDPALEQSLTQTPAATP